jgi:hypothetical protein
MLNALVRPAFWLAITIPLAASSTWSQLMIYRSYRELYQVFQRWLYS